MNVRLDHGSIRCRLAPEEARRLLAGEPLVMELALGEAERWTLELGLGPTLGARFRAFGLELQVPAAGLEAALARAPSKEAGVYGTQVLAGQVTELSVEIDVRRPRRSR